MQESVLNKYILFLNREIVAKKYNLSTDKTGRHYKLLILITLCLSLVIAGFHAGV